MTPVKLEDIDNYTDLTTLIKVTIEYLQDNHRTMGETEMSLHLAALYKATELLRGVYDNK